MTAKLGIVTGLAFEAELLRPYLSDAMLVACAGLAPGAAARAGAKLVEDGATALMSFGIAGGIDPAVQAGTAIIATDIRGVEMIVCDLEWCKRLGKSFLSPSPHPSPHRGRHICRGAERSEGVRGIKIAALAHAVRVLTSPTVKAQLFADTGAVAADMESYGVAEVAKARGLPFTALRVVADTARDSVPPVAVQSMGMDGRVRLGASIVGALTHPTQIPELIRLGRRTATATKVLAALADLGAPRLFGLG